VKKLKIKKIINILVQFKKKNIFTLAAAVAFYAFLSLFPFFIMLIYFSTLFLKETIILEKVKNYIRIFPAAVSDTFTGNLESILESGQVISFVSFIFLIYFAFKVFSSLEQALSVIYGTRTKRRGWVGKFKAFVFFLFTAFFLLLLFLSGSTFLVLASKLEKIPVVKSYYVILIADFVVEAAFFSFSYRYFSSRKLPFKNLLIGGIVAAVLWEILKHVFGIYIASIDRYSIVYGSIGSIILLQLWLYYSVLVYLLGAEISAELE